MKNIILCILFFCSIFEAAAQGVSFSSSRGEIVNGRISPGGHFSATDSEGNFVNGHVSPGGHLSASDSNGNFINGHISPGGHFSGSDSNGNFLNGNIIDHDPQIMRNRSWADDEEISVRPKVEVEFDAHDNLNKVHQAVQILDALDSIERHNAQMAIEVQRYNIAKQQLELDLRKERKLIDQKKLEMWKEDKAREALSYAAAAIPHIDMDSPDGEKKLTDWILYARANYVYEDSIQFIFGNKIRERNKKIELLEKSRAEALGAEGLKIYKAFLEEGVPPNNATLLAMQSIKAHEILTYWKNLAMGHGIPFDIPLEEMKNIKKRIGKEVGFTNPVTGRYFDASIYYYDLEATNAAISKNANNYLKALYASNPINR